MFIYNIIIITLIFILYYKLIKELLNIRVYVFFFFIYNNNNNINSIYTIAFVAAYSFGRFHREWTHVRLRSFLLLLLLLYVRSLPHDV